MPEKPEEIILHGSQALLKPVIMQVLAMKQILDRKDIGHIYGIPIEEYDRKKIYRPQVTLHFIQDDINMSPDFIPVTGQISFILMNETSKSITTTTLQSLATKIKEIFATGTPYKWSKGKELVRYYDLDKGYNVKVLCTTKTEGKSLIQKLLSVRNHEFEAKYMKLEKDEDETTNYPTIPANINVLGDTIKEPRKRPVADVRFTHAEIAIWARGHPVVLVDITGRYPTALLH